jgi:hypothetical protein
MTGVRWRVMAGVLVAAGAFAIVLTPAHGDAIDELSVYSGRAIATPLGVVSRVPAESAGGVLYSESRLDIGKTRAIAAGETAGELAEAFFITSIQGYNNPTLVNAQYPPSAAYPSEAHFPSSVEAGQGTALRFKAVADGSPSASGEAIGGAGDAPNVIHIGGGTSKTKSFVKSDGTVISTAVSTVHDVRIGNDLAPALTIGTMTSEAQVEVPFSGKPKTTLNVQMGGAVLAGVPVTITQDGITIATSAAVPASSVLALNQALAGLDAQGLSIRAVPVEKSATETEGIVSGAALQFRYVVPANVALPTDIGKDETMLLGEVSANATGRKRQPLSPGTPPPLETPVAAVSPDTFSNGGDFGAPTSVGADTALPAPSASSGSSAATGEAGPPPFRLPSRARNVVSDSVLDGYRLILSAAVIAAVAYLLQSRTRLPD